MQVQLRASKENTNTIIKAMQRSNIIANLFYVSLIFNAVANIIPVDDIYKEAHDIAELIDGVTRMIFDILFNFNMFAVNLQFAKFF